MNKSMIVALAVGLLLVCISPLLGNQTNEALVMLGLLPLLSLAVYTVSKMPSSDEESDG